MIVIVRVIIKLNYGGTLRLIDRISYIFLRTPPIYSSNYETDLFPTEQHTDNQNMMDTGQEGRAFSKTENRFKELAPARLRLLLGLRILLLVLELVLLRLEISI